MLLLKRAIFVLLVAIFPILIALHLVFPDQHTVFLPLETARPVLIVDAGHGGEDGGAISLTGAKESQINLAVAKRIDLISGLFGAPVVMVRHEDISLHDEGAKSLREKKSSDLHNRVTLVNSMEGVLLSIHQNSFPSGKYGGAQVFYAPTDGSEPLAETIQQNLRAILDLSNNRQVAKIPKTVYLMNHIACPAVLVECGFLTNPTEAQRLQEPRYQTRLATAITGSWLQFSGGPSF